MVKTFKNLKFDFQFYFWILFIKVPIQSMNFVFSVLCPIAYPWNVSFDIFRLVNCTQIVLFHNVISRKNFWSIGRNATKKSAHCVFQSKQSYQERITCIHQKIKNQTILKVQISIKHFKHIFWSQLICTSIGGIKQLFNLIIFRWWKRPVQLQKLLFRFRGSKEAPKS